MKEQIVIISFSLFKVENRDEACEFEYVHDVVVDALECHAAAGGLGALDDGDEDAEAAGSNVFKVVAVDDDGLAGGVVEGFEDFFSLDGGGGVHLAGEGGDKSAVDFFDFCVHGGVVVCLSFLFYFSCPGCAGRNLVNLVNYSAFGGFQLPPF